jgi:hypothetical protein
MSDDRRTAHSTFIDLAEHTRLGRGPQAVVELLFRLATEVEALRQTLSDPRVPDSVRASYRDAHARTVTLAHNSVGLSGGSEKILGCYFNSSPTADRLAPELWMAVKLGAGPEELAALRARLEEVEMYT